MHLPPSKHASKFGVIKLHFRKRTRTLTYEQKGGWQSRADVNGISLDAHIHALYGLVLQHAGKRIDRHALPATTVDCLQTRQRSLD